MSKDTVKIFLDKEPNTCFMLFTCGICGDVFEGDDFIYFLESQKDKVVCYSCADKSIEEAIKNLQKKIDRLENSIQYLKKAAADI